MITIASSTPFCRSDMKHFQMGLFRIVFLTFFCRSDIFKWAYCKDEDRYIGTILCGTMTEGMYALYVLLHVVFNPIDDVSSLFETPQKKFRSIY